MDIKVLGSGGCANCTRLTEETQRIADELGLDATVSKVTDVVEAMGYGVMAFPALVVDGSVAVSGRVATEAEIRKALGG